MYKLLTKLFVLSSLLFVSIAAAAQNDNCNNAIDIVIPTGGFGLGTFNSGINSLTSATLEAGEAFAPSIVTAGLNKKSIWYKFSLPTTRAARISLAQSGSMIQNGNVGFAVYKTNTCLPGTAAISTKFTPIEIFGSSFHPCVDAGDYLVQVTSNLNANGPVFITLDLSDSASVLYDKPLNAQVFTNINTNTHTIHDFLVQCQSIDNAAENCLPNGSFKDYSKSTWHTFTTPAYFDWFNVMLADLSNPSNPNAAKYTVGYRIYEGNSRTTPVASLMLLGGCDSLRTNGYYYDYKMYRCGDLKLNTTYTVQLLYHKDHNKTMRIAVAWNGVAPTIAPQPLSSMPTPNNIGVLPTNSSNGITTILNDNFGCNSRHSLYNCPKSMPVNGVVNNGYGYKLSTFYSFRLTTSTTAIFNAVGGCGSYLMRLYKQPLTTNCNDLDTTNLLGTFQNSQSFQCLESGDYVLQVMGRDTLIKNDSYYFGNFGTGIGGICLNTSDLGRYISLQITAKTEVASNKFSLSAPGRFDKINANGTGVMQPLIPYVVYNAQKDTFGCANTVMPAGITCPVNQTKVSYREFVVADSSLIYPAGSGIIFKGDANALATSQNVFNYPQTISGLISYSKCYSTSFADQYACIIPGTYSIASYDIRSGMESNLQLSIRKPVSKHSNSSTPQDMGDLWSYVTPNSWFRSDIDTFTCRDNADTIAGLAPCATNFGPNATKLIYRQFYLSRPSSVSITNWTHTSGDIGGAGMLSLFRGKSTDGISTLQPVGGQWTCFYTASSGAQCDVLPVGWYTVVSYGAGPSFSNPLQGLASSAHVSQLGGNDLFYIYLRNGCAEPKFSRPSKASIDTLTGQPYKIEWGPQTGHTAAYPITNKKYTLNRENFNCNQDTAFIRQYTTNCNADNVKVAFYVFKTTQESYIQIDDIDEGLWSRVYAFDVRTADSSRLKTDTSFQPCLSRKGQMEFCKLLPGTYTLVYFAPASYTCNTITPTIYIDQVGTSRFDHANKAYDFGAITPDSAWRNGKPGDVNPLDATRAPSNDFFYCTTGAQALDPDLGACITKYNPFIYSPTSSVVLHPNNTIAPQYNDIDRRNLWYTFTVNHPGTVRVKVNNKTLNKKDQYTYAIYKSDVNGTLSFTQVVANNLVDSTLKQGLTFISRNHYAGNHPFYCDGPQVLEFYVAPCSFTPSRYYIVVENRNSYPYSSKHAMNPNSQVEVSVLFDSVSAKPPKFDHFSQANDLGVVNSGIKKGETDNFTCATRDLPDPLYSYTTCQKTLWYKFTTTTTGQIRYAAFFKNTNQYNYDHIQLFKQVRPNDSTNTGLTHLLYGSTYSNNGTWAQQCISPGTYYIILPGCNAIDEDVYPQIEIIPQAGDFCSAPMVATLNGPGTALVPVRIDCHTIGTDYGEFNPTLTCPAGAATNQYKSSWYRLDIAGTDTLDVTVFINENTNASSTDIKYRMMTGNCGAMQEQSCVQDALTRNTYKCLAPGNSYFIQVMTPTIVNATPVIGTIDLNIAAVLRADTCLPANNCIAVANFTSNFDCTREQSVRFVNNSTFGTSVSNLWDFGYNNQTSNSVSPTFFYPALTIPKTYTAKLFITNSTCGKRDSVIQTITIPARPAVDLGRDTVICTAATSMTLNATSHSGATYSWFNGSTQPAITLSGQYPDAWVEVTYAGCKARDTVSLMVNPIARRPLQTKALCNIPQVTLDANRSSGEQYLWSTGATTASISASVPGYYWVDLYWRGCFVRDSFYVITSSLNPLGNDTTLCQNQIPFTANATVNGATSYKWQNNSTNSTLTINQPGLYWVEILIGGCTYRDTLRVGIDSVAILNTAANICEGQTYTLPWGLIVNSSGIYRDTVRYTSGCDSLRRSVNLTVKNVVTLNINAGLCNGQSYTLPWGTVVNTAGIYRDTLRYTSGCDSVRRTVNLSVQTLLTATPNASICNGQTYTLPWGAIVNTAGIYRDTVRYTSGCDSVRRIVTLTVQNFTATTTTAKICTGQSFTLPWGEVVTTTGVYKDTLRYTAGCDSLRRTVNLTVQTSTSTTINAGLCAGQTYTLPWGTVVNVAGTYRDTLRYTTGCDSVKRTVNLTVQDYVTTTTNANICSGQNYTLPWGSVVNLTGTYRDTLRYASGCDSVRIVVNLTVQNFTSTLVNASICFGQTYTLPWGAVVNTSGIYWDTLRYITGCDSIRRTVSLSVRNFTTQTVNANICSGQTYNLPWGAVVNASGTYRDTLPYITGCDSIRRTVNLTVQNFITQTVNASICSGQTYTLPWGAIVNVTGIYRDTLFYATGCDSVRRTINLTIQNFATTVTNANICAGQTYTLPWGNIVNTAGTYRDTLHYLSGCDSIRRTVNLAVQSPVSVSVSASICAGQSYTLPWGAVVNVTGVYKDTLHYSTGCDSLRRSVSLTVQAPAVSMMKETICAGLSYTLPSGTTVNTSGIYRDTLRYATGCDSLYRIVTLTVTAAQATDVSKTICSDQTYRLPWGVVVNTSGIYIDTVRTSIGCDSLIRRVNLTVNPKPVVNVSKSNDVTCALATTKLQVTGGVSWQWSPAASLSDPYAQNPVASPTTNTVYQVIVTGANGCQAKGSISVFFAAGPGNNKYLVPSAFTPNGDGQNDCFGVPHWGRVSDFALTIFNRYGHTVFQTNDPSRCWDGVYKGERQNSAALVYIITAKGVCGDISRKGTVMLIR